MKERRRGQGCHYRTDRPYSDLSGSPGSKHASSSKVDRMDLFMEAHWQQKRAFLHRLSSCSNSKVPPVYEPRWQIDYLAYYNWKDKEVIGRSNGKS